MTRKDFDLIAATLKHARFYESGGCTPAATIVLNYLSRDFAERLKATNQQFNADKFLRACGVTP